MDSAGDVARLVAVLELVEPMGNESFIYARRGGHRCVARVPPGTLPAPGERVELTVRAELVHLFDEGGRALVHALTADRHGK